MKVKDFSYLEARGLVSQFLEIRVEYDGSNNPIFVGYNHTPNAGVDSPTWFIVKENYTGGNLTRQQLPDDGVRFVYTWTDRATYFS